LEIIENNWKNNEWIESMFDKKISYFIKYSLINLINLFKIWWSCLIIFESLSSIKEGKKGKEDENCKWLICKNEVKMMIKY
jgi:hypothetical protein